MFLTKTFIVAHFFIFNLLEKGMGFSILSLYFMFIVVFSWFCEVLLMIWEIWCFEHGFVICVEFDWMGSVVLDFKLLDVIIIMFVASVLS